MRIALLSWESMHSIYVGGIAVHVSELASSLAYLGHEVHIFTRPGIGQDTYSLIDGVHYHRCPHELSSHFIEEAQHMCDSFVHHLYEHEAAYGPFDLVHAHDWLTVNAMVRIKTERGRKTVFTMHSTEYGRCGNHTGSGESAQIAHLEWLGMYHADRVVAVSKRLKEELCMLYGTPEDKVAVIYNGVNCKKFDGWIDAQGVRRMYEIGREDPIILFAGRMVYQKGPDVLMEAVPSILKYYPHAKFVFGGDGGMRSHVEDISHKMGVSDNMRFLGHLSGWRLHDLFKTADCVCVPSRNEPFGIVILEAWSAGKPVVASVNGGPSEFVWHDVNGFKVEATPESTAWGLGTTLADLEHAQWMGRNGRLTAETIFSWDTIASETNAVYS